MELGQRTLIMGVVNITPDSFSDGGRFFDPQTAVAQGLRLIEQGADILDIGGESTRPGSEAVPLEEELRRVLPVIHELARKTPVLISIDTSKAEVARQALEAGAGMINDISALREDPRMAGLAAESGAALVLMHMKGRPKTMQKEPRYGDVVAEVKAFLHDQAQAAMAAGVSKDHIVLDPGIGFGKNLDHNLLLIREISQISDLGFPVLLGASRKSFIGLITGNPVEQRLWGTLGVHVLGAGLGAHLVRVHDVAPMKEALEVSDAVLGAGEAA
jgi:dihydropteroate synthase